MLASLGWWLPAVDEAASALDSPGFAGKVNPANPHVCSVIFRRSPSLEGQE